MGTSPRNGNGPRESILPARRREALLDIVRTAGQATVSDLANHFGVSLDTVRRDIELLADQGQLTRTHGGAVALSVHTSPDFPLEGRMQEHQDAKRRIAQVAARLVRDGDTVILNGGTTTLAVAACLGDRRNLTIVTNNVLLPAALPEQAVRDIYLIGGIVRTANMATTGPPRFPASDGQSSLAMTADIAMLGVSGVSVGHGLSSTNPLDAQMMREMADAASRLVVVADASKIGRDSFAQICPLDRVDDLVSDIDADHPIAAALARTGGRLVAVADRA